MIFLRSNTAVIVAVGPFYDKTDGVTPEIALTITNERITLIAETDAGSAPTLILDNITGATSGTANDLNYITNGDNAMMQIELAAADVNRVGRMKLTITDAANHVPVFHEFFVLPQAIFDWLTGVIVPLPANVTQLLGTAHLAPVVAGTPDVNVKLFSNDATAADNAEAFFDGTGYAGTGNIIPTVTTLTNLPAITANWLTTAGIADGAFTAAKFATGAFDAVWTVTTRALSAGAAALESSLQSLITTVGAAGAGLTAAASAAIQAIRDRISPLVTKTGAVVSDGGNSATTFVTDLTESTNDYWKDSYLRLTSDVLINQVKKITAYNGTTKAVTVLGGFTGTPAAGVTFEIVND